MPKTIAFGAVATGNIKAQLADSAAGNINTTGSIPEPNAVAAKIGISNAVVAVLLVISVKKVTHVAIISTVSMIESFVTIDKLSPISLLTPVTSKALAIANPPANKSKTPH